MLDSSSHAVPERPTSTSFHSSMNSRLDTTLLYNRSALFGAITAAVPLSVFDTPSLSKSAWQKDWTIHCCSGLCMVCFKRVQANASCLVDMRPVFDLPDEILYNIELKARLNATLDFDSEDTKKQANDGIERPELSEGAPANAASCALCSLTFASVQEQREHVRSDLHGYNLKQKMRGLRPVEEKDFDRLVGGMFALRWLA